ncbi:MAG: hypothetical protein OHK0053_34650 [Microscillaceae bacterium]
MIQENLVPKVKALLVEGEKIEALHAFSSEGWQLVAREKLKSIKLILLAISLFTLGILIVDEFFFSGNRWMLIPLLCVVLVGPLCYEYYQIQKLAPVCYYGYTDMRLFFTNPLKQGHFQSYYFKDIHARNQRTSQWTYH